MKMEKLRNLQCTFSNILFLKVHILTYVFICEYITLLLEFGVISLSLLEYKREIVNTFLGFLVLLIKGI